MGDFCAFEGLYNWVDSIPLTRRKRNISRDFSDAVLLAEILKYYFPKLVDLHNYTAVNSKSAKMRNWELLNQKVLKKLQIPICNEMIEDLSSASPGAVEQLLAMVRDTAEKTSHASQECLPNAQANEDEEKRHRPTYNEINEMLKDCKQRLEEKDEIINALKGDAVHLNDLIKLKDQRIADLSMQLKRIQQK